MERKVAFTRRERYYLGMAHAAAGDAEEGTGGTCSRLRVGACIVLNDAVVGTGYNGAPAGLPHCDHSRCDTHDEPWGTCARDLAINAPCVQSGTRGGHCENVVHAEKNAIGRCVIRPLGGIEYTTHTPCWECFKFALNSGIVGWVWDEVYRPLDQRIVDAARKNGFYLKGPFGGTPEGHGQA